MAFDSGMPAGAMPAEQLYRLGLMYSTASGAASNLVEAHKWFNLAALRGYAPAKLCRREIADQMTSAQISQAQRAAREWLQSR